MASCEEVTLVGHKWPEKFFQAIRNQSKAIHPKQIHPSKGIHPSKANKTKAKKINPSNQILLMAK